MRLIFIGNSHTFANGMPFQAGELLRQGGMQAGITMLATPGVTLGWHARQAETQMALKYGAWDWVFLQQKSHPFDGFKKLRKECQALLRCLRKPARAALFMTWPEKRFPENGEALDDAFRRVAAETGAALAPVSAAWRLAGEASPEIELYAEDGAHASPAGSYLAACVFYAMVSGRSPQGLAGQISLGGDLLAGLPEERAERLQEAAWRAINRPGFAVLPL